MLQPSVFHSRKTVNSKFLMIVLPIVAFFTIGLMGLSAYFMHRDLQADLDEAVQNLAIVQSASVSSYLWRYNIKGLKQSLNPLVLYPGVSNVLIHDENQELIAEVYSFSKGEPEKKIKEVITHETLNGVKAIGSLTIAYHYRKVYGRIFNQFLRDSLFLIVLVTVIIASTLLANRIIIGRPLKKFIAAVRRADSDNVRRQVNWTAKDELGRTIAAYNKLIIRLTANEIALSRSEKKLQQTLSELSQSERAMQTLLKNMPGMIFRCKNNRKWEMDYVSQGCYDLTGYPPSALAKKKRIFFNDLIHPEDRAYVWNSVQKACEENRRYLLTYRIITKQNIEKWVWEQGQITETGNDSLRTLEGLIIDISDQKKNEFELKKAKEAAESANQLKDAFLAGVSHELRTPLNAILGYTHVLRKEIASPESENNLDIIEKCGNHLLGLINDLLDTAKAESQIIELEKTDFNFVSFLKSICDAMHIQSVDKGLDFFVDIDVKQLPACVNADEKRLRQILFNLLDNAIKFTDKGVVTFRITPMAAPALFCFEVSDTGIGISEEDIPIIFDPFQRSGKHPLHIKGTGLGLSITRKLVKLMNGTLQVKSRLKKGSTFRFDLELPEVKDNPECRLETLQMPSLNRLGSQTAEKMVPPPRAAIEALLEATEMGDIEVIDELLAELRDLDDQYDAFTIEMSHLARLFQLDAMNKFLTGYLEE